MGYNKRFSPFDLETDDSSESSEEEESTENDNLKGNHKQMIDAVGFYADTFSSK